MRALDLFCGVQVVPPSASQAAGFEVVGVDNDPACGDVYPGHFILGDALNPPTSLDDFDLIWASPPCPAYSRATNTEAKANHPDLVAPVRDMIAGHPCTVIENVVGSPLRRDLILTAPMFGLENLVRERWFELSWWPGLVPPPPRHAIGKCYVISSFGVTTATRLATGRFGQRPPAFSITTSGPKHTCRKNGVRGQHRIPGFDHEWAKRAMGIDIP